MEEQMSDNSIKTMAYVAILAGCALGFTVDLLNFSLWQVLLVQLVSTGIIYKVSLVILTRRNK
jgi:energy-converting hydrogenase Eha subunit H